MTIQVYPEPADASEEYNFSAVISTGLVTVNDLSFENNRSQKGTSIDVPPGTYEWRTNNATVRPSIGSSWIPTSAVTAGMGLFGNVFFNSTTDKFGISYPTILRNEASLASGTCFIGFAAYGNNRIVVNGAINNASSTQGGGVWVSTNFTTFTFINLGSESNTSSADLVYDNGYFVSANGAGDGIDFSTDGVNWTLQNDVAGQGDKYSVVYLESSNTWYSAQADNTTGIFNAITSTNLVNWSTTDNPFKVATGTGRLIYRLRKANNKLFAMATLSSTVESLAYSEDEGTTWTALTINPTIAGASSEHLMTLAYFDNKYLMATRQGGILISTDITNWNVVRAGVSAATGSLKYFNTTVTTAGVLLYGAADPAGDNVLFTNDGLNYAQVPSIDVNGPGIFSILHIPDSPTDTKYYHFGGTIVNFPAIVFPSRQVGQNARVGRNINLKGDYGITTTGFVTLTRLSETNINGNN